MTTQEGTLIVVPGGAGYLGTVLVPMLLDKGYHVRVVDRFFFGTDTLAHVKGRCELVEADTRWCSEDAFEGAYAVIDLAALSNDPSGELNQQCTRDINFEARVRTAHAAKAAGAKRYILASTCSVYGFQENLVDETATPAPITTYAQSNLRAEEGVLPLSDATFAVTALRQGTLYGLSKRMRFDLVVNAMSLSLHKDSVITVRGGEQWRPLLHVADSARAFMTVLEAEEGLVRSQIFNVGGNEHNYKVVDVAQSVLRAGDGKGTIMHDTTSVDTRSYRVSSDKIHSVLGFAQKRTPLDGAREILKALEEGSIAADTKTRTIDWYKQLLAQDPGVLEKPFLTTRTV